LQKLCGHIIIITFGKLCMTVYTVMHIWNVQQYSLHTKHLKPVIVTSYFPSCCRGGAQLPLSWCQYSSRSGHEGALRP